MGLLAVRRGTLLGSIDGGLIWEWRRESELRDFPRHMVQSILALTRSG